MRYTDGAKNLMLDALGAVITHISLHTLHPGPSGANELSGGSPAYARQAVAWDAASGGSKSMTGTESFAVPAGVAVEFVGFWTALTGGTFYGSAPGGSITPVPFYAASSDTLTADAHGLVDGNSVVVFDTGGAVLPAGLVEGTVYFVRDAVGDSLKLAATLGGSAIDLTTDGAGFLQKIVVETFAAQGSYQVTSLSLPLNL